MKAVWVALTIVLSMSIGCGKNEAPVASPAPIEQRVTEPNPADGKSMLKFDYVKAWVKHAPKSPEADTIKPTHDNVVALANGTGQRTIVIKLNGTDETNGTTWMAFCESLSNDLIENGAHAASREVVEGMHPLQRVRYNSPSRQGVVTIGLMRAGQEVGVTGEAFPASDAAGRAAIANAPQEHVFLVITVDEK